MRVCDLAFALATILGMAGNSGCKCIGRCGGGDAAASPRVHLGAQTGDTTATATYPNSCEVDLDFGDVPIGLIDTAVIQIENIGDAALDLSQVMPSLDPEFVVNWGTQQPIQPGSFGQITVTFQPYNVGQVTSTFTIPTNGVNSQCPAPTGSSADNTVTVTLTGNGIQLSLVVQPNVLDFGDTLLNTVATKSVMLINKSTASVTGITATVIGGDANLFVVDDAPATLGAGDSATVDISYSPLALETRSLASVQFAGSDGEKAALNLFGEPVVGLTLAHNPIDFGFVPLMTTVVGCTTVANQTSVPVNVTAASSLFSEGGAFALATTDDATPPNPFSLPITLAGDASAKVCFQFTPAITQQYSGQVTLTTDDPSVTTNPVVQLTGWGGGPQISCAPASLDFGATAAYTLSTIPVICTNAGTAVPVTGLLIGPPTASPAVFSAQLDQSIPLPPNGLAPGESAQIDVSYAATTTSSDEGMLAIASNGGRGQPVQIPLSGQGLALPPCQFAISPTAINFGNVPPGQTSEAIPFEVRNVGTDSCVVQSLNFQGDSGSSFHVVSAAPDWDPALGNAIVLPAPTGDSPSGVTFMLAFEPTVGGSRGAYSVDGVV